jgi:hypothetical protein
MNCADDGWDAETEGYIEFKIVGHFIMVILIYQGSWYGF